jgi:2-dehydropantoate 2-reductase
MEAIHIVGAGGIGCAVGHALASAGVPVTFIEANAAKVDWGRAHGVGLNDLPPAPARFLAFAEWSPPPSATVLLCTKCYDNGAVLARLPATCALIPIQNGFDRDLQDRPPHVEGIASFVSEGVPNRAHTRITRAGRLHLGPNGAEQRDRLLPRARELAALLKLAAFPTQVVPDILPLKYTKLMYNAAISPLAASAGLDNGDVLRLPRVRGLFFALLRENHAILERAGVPLGKIGPFSPATVARILRRPWLAHALSLFFRSSLRGTYCSMFNDLPAGRTEIDNYNRHLIDLAGDGPCPLNRLVVDLVHRMEREAIPPGPAVLDELVTEASWATPTRLITSQSEIISGPRR